MKKIQFLLVSEQPTPNLTPLVDSNLKPDEVVLITTPEQENSGRLRWLTNVVNNRGIRVHQASISTAWEYGVIYEELKQHVQKHNIDDALLELNITGGTKPMSIAAYQLFYFELNNKSIFYVQNDQVYWITKQEEETNEIHPLVDNLNLRDFMAVHGARIDSMDQTGTQEEIKSLGNTWLRNAHACSLQIGKLNRLANEAEGRRPLTVERSDEDYNDQGLVALIDDLEGLNFISTHGLSLTFLNEKARFFANGGWLDEIVYDQVLEVFRNKEDAAAQGIAKNLIFFWADEDQAITKTKNELDVCFLYKNKLHIIECKTSNMMNDDKADDALYKLNALKGRAGGLAAKAMLISYRELRKVDKERADLMHIKYCDGQALESLTESLKEFIFSQ